MRSLTCVLTAAVVLATGCATSMPSGSAQPAPPAAAPGLEAFYGQELGWGSCQDFALNTMDQVMLRNPELECTRLTVPLDYAAPGGATAQIAVVRRQASGQRIGSLVGNPGGPGASGVSFTAQQAEMLAGTPLGERFDLVGFDPRGVGSSTPTIDCLNDADWEAERADLDVDASPEGVAASEQENRQYAQRCVERSGGPQVLANVGTRDVVRDLDILRAALGDEKLTYVGYSYGTRIGAAYAEAFPQNVRALVLDGALDPNETTVDRTVNQNAGFQHAFDAFAADCAQYPDCPLGTDPAQATTAFQVLTRRLIDQPATSGSRTLSYPDAVTGTIQALYLSDTWPMLRLGLSQLATGDGTALLQLADSYNDRGPDGRYGNLIEAFTVISCVDEDRITDRAQEHEMLRRTNEVAPFRDPGRGINDALEPCAFWPVPPTGKAHLPQVSGLAPTLTISVTGDPATPYEAGVKLAEALGGALLPVEGDQHTASLRGNPCIDDIVTAYLVDLRLPQQGANCQL